MTQEQTSALQPLFDKAHKHYDLCRRAHYGTSFVPEKRAQSECEYYDAIVQEFNNAGKGWAVEKFDCLFVKSMSAKSRLVSTMIAGPARFPVARMEKYNRWEHSATQAMLDFVDKVRQPPPEPRTELDYGIQAKEYKIGDVSVVQNTEDNRLQLLFPSKPNQSIIEKLKSRGFKWSPRNQAWQRQLTPNAIMAAKHLLEAQND